MKVKATIVTGNRNLNDRLYTEEAMKQIAEKVAGAPVTSSYGGIEIGRVEKGIVNQSSVIIEAEIDQAPTGFARRLLDGQLLYCVLDVTVLAPIDDGVIESIENVNSVFLTMEPADSHLEPITKIGEKT